MSERVFSLEAGDAPLIISIPHAGTEVPPEVQERLTSEAATLPDTDWHVPRLYAFALELGVTMLTARFSRYVIDLNRDPQGAVLYLGADNTELCPTRTFGNAAVYRDGLAPERDEIERRRAEYFDPYHAALAAECARIKGQHGFVILLDAHCIRSEVPRFFRGRLPDLNLGTAAGASCAAALAGRVWNGLQGAEGFSSVNNGRFKGGYITRHWGRPSEHCHALQLEIAQSCYMDEAPPYRWNEERASPLINVLRQIVLSLLSWRP